MCTHQHRATRHSRMSAHTGSIVYFDFHKFYTTIRANNNFKINYPHEIDFANTGLFALNKALTSNKCLNFDLKNYNKMTKNIEFIFLTWHQLIQHRSNAHFQIKKSTKEHRFHNHFKTTIGYV